MSNTVIFIGLDGLGRPEIGEWITDGTLENLRGLAEKGTFTDLTSTHPPWTPCAWPSALSGRNPGKHGVFDFFSRDGYDKELVDRESVDAPFFFEVADDASQTPIVINFPITHPASSLENGAIVPGYLARENVEFHPADLRSRYESRYGEYRIYPDYGVEDDIVSEYTEVARHRLNMARFLDDRYDWDLLAIQFQVTDSIFHDLDDREHIREILGNVDEFVGQIVGLADDPFVLVASDHGMGDYDGTFYVNSWLAENGYCRTETGDELYFRQAKKELRTDDDHDPSTAATVIGGLMTALSKIGVSSRGIHRGLTATGLDAIVESILPDDALVAGQNEVVDHRNSVAYQLLFNSLGVHLNVEGREPNGRVSQQEYESVRTELLDELAQVRDPDGNLIFDEVLPTEEVYSGEYVTNGPDILLIPRDYRYDISGSLVDTFRDNPHKNHKPEGILISNRDLQIDEDAGASIYDVAPTIAAALDLPVDSDTDGEVLGPYTPTGRTDWDEIASHYRKVATDENGPTDDVEDRLADLGYME